MSKTSKNIYLLSKRLEIKKMINMYTIFHKKENYRIDKVTIFFNNSCQRFKSYKGLFELFVVKNSLIC
jgi:hypothetical protein